MGAAPHFVVADPHKQDCPIIFASAGFTALTGYGPAETLGRNCRFLQGKDTNVHAVRRMLITRMHIFHISQICGRFAVLSPRCCYFELSCNL